MRCRISIKGFVRMSVLFASSFELSYAVGRQRCDLVDCLTRIPHLHHSNFCLAMDWFGFGRRSNLPQPTPLQQQRSKQIESLKQSNQGIREIVRDQEYRLTITCPNGANLTLLLNLPANFPQDKPR